jgi:hypothetical protein
MNRRESKLLMLAMVTTLALILVAPAQAKKPLVGTMDLTFNLAWPGPSETIPEWEGTITFDGIVFYDMKFFNIGTGKQGDQDPGNTLHFGEIWKIWDEGTLILQGTDDGVVSLSNSKYRMNGVVTEAYGEFTIWEGRNVHMNGDIIWQNLGTEEEPIMAPETAPGVFRMN